MKTREEIAERFWKQMEDELGPNGVAKCRAPGTPINTVCNRLIDHISDGWIRLDEYLERLEAERRSFVRKYMG